MRTPPASTALASMVLALVVLAGCGQSAPPVDWGGKYTMTVKNRLDRLIETKDCASLRAELDTAHSIDAAKRRDYKTGSEDLVRYIQWGMDQADCTS